jgi:heptosyltransferase-1
MKTLPPLAEIERLLIVKTSSLGDVIHALPAVEAIKRANPELILGWVVRRRCADLLQGCPWIDHLYVIENKPSLRALWELRKTLRAQKFDVALDMQGLLLSGLITRLSGAPVRIGWDRNREQNAKFLTHPIVPGKPRDVGVRHEVELLYGFPHVFGVDVPLGLFSPQTFLAESGRAFAQERLAGLPSPRIALNVGSAREYKRWPAAFWTRLAQSLAETGAGLVFVGDKTDAVTVADIRGYLPADVLLVDVSGQTSLRELAAVLAGCDLLVSGDTGPMHLAVAVGTPVLALFGATDPRRHGPYGTLNHVISGPDGPTAGRPTPEQGRAAMLAISPETVLAQIAALPLNESCAKKYSSLT